MKPVKKPKHTLVAFMDDLYRSMHADYERIRAHVSEDPGTAGDEGEESWAELLRKWLPATYPVVTKGRVINSDGEASRQLDVLVLHPAYPQHLRHKKLYLADGVIAAFECKLTLRGPHIPAAVNTAASLKRLYNQRLGTPYKELHRPIIYGLLAHSCDFTGSAVDVTFKIQERIEASFQHALGHPSEMLDVACVADAGTLYLAHNLAIGPKFKDQWRELFALDPQGGIISWFFGRSVDFNNARGDAEGAALGHLLSYLLRRMAWEDASLRRLSQYFEQIMRGSGVAPPTFWPANVLSDAVIHRLLQRGCNEDNWSGTTCFDIPRRIRALALPCRQPGHIRTTPNANSSATTPPRTIDQNAHSL
jgi:hypothetical protein